MTLEKAIYQNTGLRGYLKRILGRKHQHDVDDLIQEALVIVMQKYDLYYLLADGCLPFVVRETARLMVLSQRGRFRRLYFRRTVDGYVPPESGNTIQRLDEFYISGGLTDFEKIMIVAMEGESSISDIARESGVARKTLSRHAGILKIKYKKWLENNG